MASHPISSAPHGTLASRERHRCYGCYRSLDACFCDLIPRIYHRTQVLILQHMRERTHPFNTARILRRSLANSRLLVDHNDRLAQTFDELSLSPQAGLLYPGSDATLLDSLDESQKPDQLVIIDGTWHHTKTMLRDIPRLRALPKYCLAPTEPSRYGIRREPHAAFLSTLEATIASLRSLEPETIGFDELIAAFETMVHRQQAHPKARYGWRKNLKHGHKPIHVPETLRGNLENVVAVYAEVTSERERKDADQPSLVYWTAQRLVSGERFDLALAFDPAPTDSLLRHLELPASAFANAASWGELEAQWNAFLKPNDTLVFYYSHIRHWLERLSEPAQDYLYLRGIQFNKRQKNGTLDDVLQKLQITPDVSSLPSRPAKRLANTIALIEYLNTEPRQSTP